MALNNLTSQISSKVTQTKETIQNKINNIIAEYVVKSLDDGFNGFRFSVFEKFDVDLTYDITDHPVEAGFTIQQGAVLKPTILKVSGIVSEIETKRDLRLEAMALINVKTNTLNRYSPVGDLTQGGIQQFNNIASTALQYVSYFENLYQDGMSFYDVITRSTPLKTNQEKAFAALKGMIGRPVTIGNLYNNEMFTNMYITNISFSSELKRSKFDCAINITFKEVKEVKIDKDGTLETKRVKGRQEAKQATTTNKGKAQGVKLPFNSIGYNWTH